MVALRVCTSHGAVLLLACGVENVEQAGLIVDGHLLSVAVLDRGIVLIDEVVLNL